MANIQKVLHRKPGILRSVYGREQNGLRDQEFESTVQQKDLKTNEPIIVAEVFGTPGVQKRQPTINYFDQLIQITGQVEVNDDVIHGSLICWYNKYYSRLILLDSSTLVSQVPEMVTYLMVDSVFPVLMTQNHQPLPVFPDGYSRGFYLGLMSDKQKHRQSQSVFIVDSPTNTTLVDCQTYAADLVCIVRMAAEKRSGNRIIRFILDGYDQTVTGLYAALNQPMDQKITTELDRIPAWNHRLSNRYMFLVGNDGYLCISEQWDSNKSQNSLIKENTYLCCHGFFNLNNVFKANVPLGKWETNIPYRNSFLIIPEGVQYMNLVRYDCRPLDCGQLTSYIHGFYYVSDLEIKILELDSIQLSNDLLGQTNPVFPIEPVMALADISDCLLYEYRDNNVVLGHIIFSLIHNISEKNYFNETFAVFMCLDETNWSAGHTLYQLVGQCFVSYNKKWISNQLSSASVRFISNDPRLGIIKLTQTQLQQWRAKQTGLIPVFGHIDNWRSRFLPIINTTPLREWHNVGVNLADRYRCIQDYNLIFPKSYGSTIGLKYRKPRIN